ncbi:hypothetical protein HDV00_006387 [Rhizophlyctis rosea]|nr:hypothetical protein HDV00_006387 [Rhizophlyctis rosea]
MKVLLTLLSIVAAASAATVGSIRITDLRNNNQFCLTTQGQTSVTNPALTWVACTKTGTKAWYQQFTWGSDGTIKRYEEGRPQKYCLTAIGSVVELHTCSSQYAGKQNWALNSAGGACNENGCNNDSSDYSYHVLPASSQNIELGTPATSGNVINSGAAVVVKPLEQEANFGVEGNLFADA